MTAYVHIVVDDPRPLVRRITLNRPANLEDGLSKRDAQFGDYPTSGRTKGKETG